MTKQTVIHLDSDIGQTSKQTTPRHFWQALVLRWYKDRGALRLLVDIAGDQKPLKKLAYMQKLSQGYFTTYQKKLKNDHLSHIYGFLGIISLY